ncbi:hypothetical protein [Burkholderia sp. BCC1047]|uniref:hypothetical protein n=1 Tax=Burkholderia sp. BCC1047 TaxID=2676299 RepID=UPI00158F462D|nr:hypothetical protein [Burkholderia sp. BCC1047]
MTSEKDGVKAAGWRGGWLRSNTTASIPAKRALSRLTNRPQAATCGFVARLAMFQSRAACRPLHVDWRALRVKWRANGGIMAHPLCNGIPS